MTWPRLSRGSWPLNGFAVIWQATHSACKHDRINNVALSDVAHLAATEYEDPRLRALPAGSLPSAAARKVTYLPPDRELRIDIDLPLMTAIPELESAEYLCPDRAFPARPGGKSSPVLPVEPFLDENRFPRAQPVEHRPGIGFHVGHRGLALVHDLDHLQACQALMGDLLCLQRLRDHAVNLATAGQRRDGQDAHQPDIREPGMVASDAGCCAGPSGWCRCAASGIGLREFRLSVVPDAR